MMGRVLANSGLFLFGDDGGDIPIANTLGFGLYHLNTRYLSALTVEVAGQPPIALSTSNESSSYQSIQLANQAFTASGREVPQETISVRRNRFIDGALHERLGLLSYNRFEVPVEITLTFAADYRDILDVRGSFRGDRGQVLDPSGGQESADSDEPLSTVALSYRGPDGLIRRTDILFDTPPTSREVLSDVASGFGPSALLGRIPRLLSSSWEGQQPVPGVRLRFRILLEPSRPHAIGYSVHPSVERQVLPRARVNFDLAAARVRREYEERWSGSCTSITSENAAFTQLLRRSMLDLRSLLIRQTTGPLLLAGVPWYAAPIGRDALVASEQTLALTPEIAVGTLRFLAELQGTEESTKRDEEPGKILNEVRMGGLARSGSERHRRSFSAADPTPLFISLFCRTMDWLGDDNLFEELRPAVLRAVDWIDRYGDRDGDGLVEAVSRAPDGNRYPTWRSSPSAYTLPNGTAAEPPLAPIELQSYVYDAKARLARLLRRGGDVALSERLEREAEKLRELIHALYWMPDQSYYAAALDGRKVQVPLVTSSPAHLLWADALSPERAATVVRRLLADDLFSGWGIRTVSANSPSYNPMSYHNGSVWPHDNAMAVAGFRRFGYDEPAVRVGEAILEAFLRLGMDSVPELYSGFPRDRRSNADPAPYSLACAPSARSAGAVFGLVTSLLGLVADATNHRLALRPRIPRSLGSLTVRNLRVGRATVDFVAGPDGVKVLSQRGDLEVFAQ